ncbi:MAG: tetratricopeptide repeat protein, partial [Gemmataceae bacterium]|nr:tetratricopeptide repeat protein [Gemmataceae bacterium]
FLHDQKKYEPALKDYSQTLLFDPENSDALVWSAELLQRRGDTLLARETLQAAVSTYPKDVRAIRALSWLELISGNQPEALAVLEKAIQHLPEEPEVLTPLADIYIGQNDLDKVQTIISKLEKRKATLQQRYLNARLLVRQSQWANALAILEPLRTESVQYPQLTQQLNQMIALCKERLGDRAGQIEALRRTLNNDAGNLSARVT